MFFAIRMWNHVRILSFTYSEGTHFTYVGFDSNDGAIFAIFSTIPVFESYVSWEYSDARAYGGGTVRVCPPILRMRTTVSASNLTNSMDVLARRSDDIYRFFNFSGSFR